MEMVFILNFPLVGVLKKGFDVYARVTVRIAIDSGVHIVFFEIIKNAKN